MGRKEGTMSQPLAIRHFGATHDVYSPYLEFCRDVASGEEYTLLGSSNCDTHGIMEREYKTSYALLDVHICQHCKSTGEDIESKAHPGTCVNCGAPLYGEE